jgi:hypothetical protein
LFNGAVPKPNLGYICRNSESHSKTVSYKASKLVISVSP